MAVAEGWRWLRGVHPASGLSCAAVRQPDVPQRAATCLAPRPALPASLSTDLAAAAKAVEPIPRVVYLPYSRTLHSCLP